MGSKGVDQILSAMKIVFNKYQNSFLFLIGDGDLVSVESFVRQEKWMFENDFVVAIDAADIIIVPSVCFDSLPTMAIDGSAAGRPIIATCFGGAKEVVVDNKTGFVLNPYNTKLMAEKIIYLLENPDIASKMGEAGQERIKDIFSIKKQISETLVQYKKY